MFEEQCLSCIFKDASPSEGWCFLFSQPPTTNCPSYIMDRSSDAMVIVGMNYLHRNFPDKFNDY